MTRYIDIKGQKFNKLTALEFKGHDKYKNALWLCKCDCGNYITTRASSLRQGITKSCGCIKTEELDGKRFGRLTVICDSGQRKGRRRVWKCKCDCGNITYVTSYALKHGRTLSCGCLMRETTSKNFYIHGQSKSRLNTVWQGMKQRCYNPNHAGYENYGGRGIKVCDEWKNSFEKFSEWAYANGYDPNADRNACTIDRIDNDGDYEPSNCRWVDAKTQAQNQRPKKKRRS